MTDRPLRILSTYTVFPSAAYGDVERLNLDYLDRLRKAGFDVRGFCVTPDAPANSYTWPELDRRWRFGDRRLLTMYEKIEAALADCDVLINSSGSNLHPEFVAELPVFTVFACMDDPENSHNLSIPAAAAYDLSLVGNIAEVESYRSWGVKAVEWSPMGVMPEIYDPALTEQSILEGERDIDLFMMLDRTYSLRRSRLDYLAQEFPKAHFYGNGWPRGYLPSDRQRSYLKRAKIGTNIHNSTGPVNYRTFYLPANGVLQICDNKSHLGKIFELDREAVGFDTIEECADLCRYYLAHDRERREIAARGFRRAIADYAEIPLFTKRVASIRKHMDTASARRHETSIAISRRKKTKLFGALFPIVQRIHEIRANWKRIPTWTMRRCGKMLRHLANR
jgi:spore maturation protein CgeB